ncbi:MAG: hypothetical protein QJR01_05035 [Kyrpidia sp.]|nr:hypothetical protein [Kyrpidia sp.]
MAKKRIRGQEGYVLPLALMLVVLLTVLTPALLFLSSTGFLLSKHNSQAYQARYLADAAYESALQTVYRYAQQSGSPPFPLSVSDESAIINQIKGTHTSTNTTDGGSYEVVDLPGHSNPEISGGQRLYYLQARGIVGSAVSSIDFKMVFSQNSPEVLVPQALADQLPPELQSVAVYDNNAPQRAQTQRDALLTSPSYTPNVTCSSVSQMQNAIQSNLNYDPLVIKIGNLILGNNDTFTFSRPDSKQLVIVADTVTLGNNSNLTVRGTLICNNGLTMGNGSDLNVSGDVIAGSSVTFGNKIDVEVGGNLTSVNGSVTFGNESLCDVSGNLVAKGDFVLGNGGSISVDGWLAGNTLSVGNTADVYAYGGTALVYSLIVGNQAQYTFNGQLIVGQSLVSGKTAKFNLGFGNGGGSNVSFLGAGKL